MRFIRFFRLVRLTPSDLDIAFICLMSTWLNSVSGLQLTHQLIRVQCRFGCHSGCVSDSSVLEVTDEASHKNWTVGSYGIGLDVSSPSQLSHNDNSTLILISN